MALLRVVSAVARGPRKWTLNTGTSRDHFLTRLAKELDENGSLIIYLLRGLELGHAPQGQTGSRPGMPRLEIRGRRRQINYSVPAAGSGGGTRNISLSPCSILRRLMLICPLPVLKMRRHYLLSCPSFGR